MWTTTRNRQTAVQMMKTLSAATDDFAYRSILTVYRRSAILRKATDAIT